MATTVTFEATGLRGVKGDIHQYKSESDYASFASGNKYPELVVTYAPSRTIILWAGEITGKEDEGDRWEKCRKAKPVATCAKAQPAYAAANKALRDAGLRAVAGK